MGHLICIREVSGAIFMVQVERWRTPGYQAVARYVELMDFGTKSGSLEIHIKADLDRTVVVGR